MHLKNFGYYWILLLVIPSLNLVYIQLKLSKQNINTNMQKKFFIIIKKPSAFQKLRFTVLY